MALLSRLYGSPLCHFAQKHWVGFLSINVLWLTIIAIFNKICSLVGLGLPELNLFISLIFAILPCFTGCVYIHGCFGLIHSKQASELNVHWTWCNKVSLGKNPCNKSYAKNINHRLGFLLLLSLQGHLQPAKFQINYCKISYLTFYCTVFDNIAVEAALS